MIGQSAEVLIALFAAHLLGDFVMQTTKDVENKHKMWVLVRHTGLVAAASWALCGLWSIWFIPAAVFIAHLIIDFVKSRLVKDGLYTFIIDQLVHFLSLVLVARLVAVLYLPAPGFWVIFFGPGFLKFLVVLSGLIMATRVGGFLIGYMLNPMEKELAEAAQKQTEPAIFKGLTNGALFIGQLERALILIFFLAGESGGIGFLIAAKSIFRYGEVKNRTDKMTAEYIIIGTLMSFGFGILVAIVTRMVLGTI
ncbi:DUF3307 domain-containing protein [candidate division KSB1 bacterium]|nr:DUF3307 domain-containing protein [candidate division KSB1 bacterium]